MAASLTRTGLDPSPLFTSSSGRVAVGASRGARAELHYDVHAPSTSNVDDGGPRRVLCIMGLLTDGLQWWPQIESLTAAGFTVATFDNRGVGRSTAPPPPYTTSQMADDALELLGHLAWAPADTHLAGISMGGMIALELLGRTAFRSAALLVTTPTGPTHSPWPWGGGWPPWPFFATTFRQFFDPTLSARDRELMNMSLNFSAGWLVKDSGFTHPTSGQPMTNMKRVARIGAKIWFAKVRDGVAPTAGWRGSLGQLLAGATHHIEPARLAAIAGSGVPVLVVGATDDKLVRFATGSQALAAALRPREFLVCRCGHGVNVECADEVNAAMLRLFRAADSGGAGVRHTPRKASL